MKIKILFLFLIFLNKPIIFGQKIEINKFPQEKIYVHYNSNFILTGETLYFKIYCLEEKTNLSSSLSKIAYIELIDHKKSVLKQKIKLINGEGQGDFFINTTLKSGIYKIIAYTSWMKNKNLFFEDNITLINPFIEESLKNNTADSIKTVKKIPFTKKSLLTISTNKKDYQKREKVSVTISSKQQALLNGHFSLSVRQINPTSIPQKTTPFKTKIYKNTFTTKTVFLPELRGELLQGKISSANNGSLKNIKIGLSIIQKNGISKISNTNQNGYFYFNITEPYNQQKAYLQVLDNAKNYKISILKDKNLNLSYLDFPELKIDNRAKTAINKRAIYLQIENAYGLLNQDSIKVVKSNHPLINQSTTTYLLDDYTRFNTLKETFIEIIDNAWIETKEENHFFHVRDLNFHTNTNFPTLVIIDGFIVKNHNNIVNYNPRKIKKIALIREKYKISGKIYQGIIILETFKNNYTPEFTENLFIHTLFKPQELKNYFSIDYNQKSFKRVPDYRIQLLWKPIIKTLNKEFSFYTSDITGQFEIEIEGYTTEGNPVSIKQRFSVK